MYSIRYLRKTAHHKAVIWNLLKEIGAYDFEAALHQRHLSKPLDMQGYFLELKEDGVHLCYRYPLVACSIMLVNNYDNLPLTGWELEKINRYK